MHAVPNTDQRERTTTILRRAGSADAEGIARVHVRSWQAGYQGIIPKAILDRLRISTRARRWARNVEHARSRGHHVWVAERGGEIVAFAITGPGRNEDTLNLGELHAIYLLPDEWGAGTAARMLELAVTQFRHEGRPAAVLWVLEQNRRARRFYERYGWHTDGAEDVTRVGAYPLLQLRYQHDLSGSQPSKGVRWRPAWV
ncbi:MAG: GNAT family N-acetyltransferase [Dehalococcoidia bacterium]|nr:GNAT family N-acetyltransferase [Dehalococcoidia bacterium]